MSNTSNYVLQTSNLVSDNLNTAISDTSNYVQRIDAEITTRIDGVDDVDNILGFFRNTQFEKDNSDIHQYQKSKC